MTTQKFGITSSMKQIIENAGWLFVMRVLRIIWALFVTVWLARYLGPDRFGVLNYAIALVALFTPVSKLGLVSIVVRNIVRDPPGREEILGTTFILRLLGGVACLLLVAAAVSIIRPGDTEMLALAAIIATGVIFHAFETIDLLFQSQVQSKFSVYARSTALILANLVKIAMILAEAPLVAFAGVLLLESMMAAAGLVIVYRARGYRVGDWRYSLTRSRELLGESWPMILSGALAVIYLRIDQVMLGEIEGNEAVGVYSTAVRISEVWYFVPVAITDSVFPALVQSRERSAELYRIRLQQLYDFLTWLALPAALVMMFIARPLVTWLFGDDYSGGGPILAIHIWAGVFVFQKWALGKWLINEGLVKHMFVINGVGVVVNVLMNLYMIPRYGGVGAATATVVSYFASTYIACFIHPATRTAARNMTLALLLPVRMTISALKRGKGA
jgi:PST family polysaccharide transporter